MRLPHAIVIPLLLSSALALGAPPPVRVAVMDFTSAAPKGELDNLGKGLQSMITTDLSESAAFQLVERARLRDVEAELKLQKRAEIDKSTAVRIGKLAGASHLVTGSFTVVGEKMRIDCRLFAVSTGEILLAEKVEGDKASFFDLEKGLMGKLVTAVGAKVAPKERARMAKIHTADFDAFRKFSDGIGFFDEKRYEDATRVLREATALDTDFKLAHMTLAGYEELVRKARAGADAAKESEEQLTRLKRDKESALGADLAERLQTLAKKGNKVERQLAVSMLAMTYSGQVWGPLKALSDRGDAFVMARIADNYDKTYWVNAPDVVPQLPPMPWAGSQHLPETLEKFDADFAQSRKDLEHDGKGQVEDINFLYSGYHFARRLHFDQRQQADLFERLYRLGLKFHPDDQWKVSQQIAVALEYQRVLELDRSTAFLVQTQAMAKRSEDLRRVAELLDQNRELERLIGEVKLKTELREVLRYRGSYDGNHPVDDERKMFSAGVLTRQIADQLERHRLWPREEDEYLLIGDEPMWRLRSDDNATLSTGPRSDRLRADEIRYFASPTRKPSRETLIAVGAAPVDRFSVAFDVVDNPPLDWQLGDDFDFEKLKKEPPENRRPEVGLVFGMRNIGVPTHGKPAPAPLAAYAVRLGRSGVRLTRLTRGNPREALDEQPLAEWKVDLAAERKIAVTVRVDDKLVRVTVNGKELTAKTPADRAGFLGLTLAGTGFASITGVRVSRP